MASFSRLNGYDVKDNTARFNIGDITQLNTSAKENIVSAINEHNTKLVGLTENAKGLTENVHHILKYNAVGDDTTDNTSILNNLISSIGDDNAIIIIDEGTYLISGNVTIPSNIVIEFIGELDITGNLTINGEIKSPLKQIFKGTGTLTINDGKNSIGYPEWFGAKINDDTTNNEEGINKCINIFPTTIFQSGNYYISDTINVNTAGKTLKGVSNKTTIIMKDNFNKIMHVGFTSFPSEVNSLPRYFNISDIILTRNTTQYITGSIGLHTEYLLYGNFTNVIVRESCDNFLINGVVATKFNNCTSFNTTLDSDDTTRVINSFGIDGFSDIPLAGNNASLYLNGCNASFGGICYNLCHGLNIIGNYRLADIYIDKFECAMPYIGIEINGFNTTSGNDIFITNCVIDAYKEHGIYVHGFDNSSNINIDGNYIAPSSNAITPSNFGIRIENTGNTNVVNNQIICDPSTACLPLWYNNCVNVNSVGNMIMNPGRAIFFNSSDNIRSIDLIRNTTIRNNNEPAINCSNITRSYIHPSINCTDGYINGGVALNSSNKNEINITQIKGVANGSNNFIKIDNVAITTTGVTGTNLISGIF